MRVEAQARAGVVAIRPREPNGRLSRATGAIPERATPAEARRLRDAALRGMASPEWGTELGRLFLEGKITEAHYLAGKRWTELRSRYHAAIGATAVSIVPQRLEAGSRSAEPDPDSEVGQRRAAMATAVIGEMREAERALGAAGWGADQAVRLLCEYDQLPPGWAGLINVHNGLDTLVAYWRLTQKGKR